jgi:hypothetical protein
MAQPWEKSDTLHGHGLEEGFQREGNIHAMSRNEKKLVGIYCVKSATYDIN